MGVLFFLIFVIGMCWIAEEFTKKMKEEQRYINSLKSEKEKKHSASTWGNRLIIETIEEMDEECGEHK